MIYYIQDMTGEVKRLYRKRAVVVEEATLSPTFLVASAVLVVLASMTAEGRGRRLEEPILS